MVNLLFAVNGHNRGRDGPGCRLKLKWFCCLNLRHVPETTLTERIVATVRSKVRVDKITISLDVQHRLPYDVRLTQETDVRDENKQLVLSKNV